MTTPKADGAALVTGCGCGVMTGGVRTPSSLCTVHGEIPRLRGQLATLTEALRAVTAERDALAEKVAHVTTGTLGGQQRWLAVHERMEKAEAKEADVRWQHGEALLKMERAQEEIRVLNECLKEQILKTDAIREQRDDAVRAVRAAQTQTEALRKERDALLVDRDEWRTQHENLLVMFRTADATAATLRAALRACVAALGRTETAIKAVVSVADDRVFDAQRWYWASDLCRAAAKAPDTALAQARAAPGAAAKEET